MNTYIVLPTYNEAANLERLVDQAFALHPNLNIIVVDDNSPDGTGAIADSLSHENSHVHVIHRPCKAGLGTAYVQGFKEALAKGADLIFVMDADLSHNPRYLQNFLDAMGTADLVIGSRYLDGVRINGWTFRRLLLSKFANIYASLITALPVYDLTAGFRCYRRSILESIDLEKINSDGYSFQIEMTHLAFKHGFKVLEIPILFEERSDGESKISRKVVWEASWVTLKCHARFLEIM